MGPDAVRIPRHVRPVQRRAPHERSLLSRLIAAVHLIVSNCHTTFQRPSRLSLVSIKALALQIGFAPSSIGAQERVLRITHILDDLQLLTSDDFSPLAVVISSFDRTTTSRHKLNALRDQNQIRHLFDNTSTDITPNNYCLSGTEPGRGETVVTTAVFTPPLLTQRYSSAQSSSGSNITFKMDSFN